MTPRNDEKDWLLTVARVLLMVVTGVLAITMALLAFGAVAIVTFRRTATAEKIAEAGFDGMLSVWGIFAGLIVVCGLLFLAMRFSTELGRIVQSVGEGDPFMPVNAARLSRMAWLALALSLGGNAVTMAKAHFDRLAGSTQSPDNLTGSLFGGIALVLTLFILARVFRKGAEMRDEIEGTV